VAREDWDEILPAYSRCVRIIRSAKVDSGQLSVNRDQLVESAEKDLYEAILNTENRRLNTVDEALSSIETLVPAINHFFDNVLVMDEDEAIKTNRLALVGMVARLPDGIADLSHLEGF